MRFIISFERRLGSIGDYWFSGETSSLEQAYAYLPLYTVLIWHFEKFSRADYRADAVRFSFSNDMNFIHAEGAWARMEICTNSSITPDQFEIVI